MATSITHISFGRCRILACALVLLTGCARYLGSAGADGRGTNLAADLAPPDSATDSGADGVSADGGIGPDGASLDLGHDAPTADISPPDQRPTPDLLPTPDLTPDLVLPPGHHRWSRRFGSGAGVRGGNVTVDRASGHVVVVGYFSGTIDLGGGSLSAAGGTDIVLASFDANGAHRWSKRFGGVGDDLALDATVDSRGNITLIGYFFNGTIDFGGGRLTTAGGATVVASFDASGTHRWSKRLGSPGYCYGRRIAADSNGNVTLTGHFYGAIDFGGGQLTAVGGGRDLMVVSYDQNGAHRWSKRFGDASDEDEGKDVAVDSSGNVTMVGEIAGNIDFGGGALPSWGVTDVVVVSFDKDGAHRWSKRLGGTSYDRVRGVTADSSGNITLVGDFIHTVDFGGAPLTSAGGYDIVVTSFNKNGAHRWSKRLGGASSDYGYGVAADSSNNVIVVGSLQGSANFGGGTLSSAGRSDIVVASFDQNGVHRWSKRFGDAGHDLAYGVATDSSDNAIIFAHFSGSVDFGAGPLTSTNETDLVAASFDPSGTHRWSKRFLGNTNSSSRSDVAHGVATDRNGNVTFVGSFWATVDFGGGSLTSAGNKDIVVAGFDNSGAPRWSRRFGGTGNDEGYGVAKDSSGNVTVVGSFADTVDFGGGPLTSAGDSDIVVVSFDQNGAHRWSKRFGSTGNDEGYGVATDSGGNVTVVGSFADTVDFGGGPLTSTGDSDIVVVSFDKSGAHRWSKRFGGADSDRAYGVTKDSSGNATVVGYFSGTVDFGGGPLTSAGDSDIVVVSFDQNGAHRWSKRFGDRGRDAAEGVTTDSSGNVTFVGYFSGTVDFGGGATTPLGPSGIVVASYRATGAHRWSRHFGSPQMMVGFSGSREYGVAADSSGNVTLVGHFRDSVDFGGGPLASATSIDDDIVVASYAPDGAHRWSKRFGGASYDIGHGVATDRSGNVVVVGSFNNVVDFGGGPLISEGNGDIFIASFSP
jgi:hypothetical protein